MSALNIPIRLASTTVNGVEFTASLPTRGTVGAAGYDLYAYLPQGTFTTRVAGQCEMTGKDGIKHLVPCEYRNDNATSIPVGGRALIPTGVSMAIPLDWYGRNAPRSGLAWKDGQGVMAGVIDSDYRGDDGVILHNTGSVPFQVGHGDRIAQIIFERCGEANFQITTELGESQRGSDGYGSTGVSSSVSPRSGLPKGGFRLALSDESLAQISSSHRRTISTPDDTNATVCASACTPSISAIPECIDSTDALDSNEALSSANMSTFTRAFPGSAEIAAAHGAR